MLHQNQPQPYSRAIYSVDMVGNNLGRRIRVHLNFLGNGPPDLKIFQGTLLYVGVDFLILKEREVGNALIYWTNVAYVVFIDGFDLKQIEDAPKEGEEFIYALDIYKLNQGKNVTVWLNFIGNSPPEQRIFKGSLLVVGADSFIVGSERVGGPTLAYYVNLAYVIFHEELIFPEKTSDSMMPEEESSRRLVPIEKPTKPQGKLSVQAYRYPFPQMPPPPYPGYVPFPWN